MNYIKQLQADLNEANSKLEGVRTQLREFSAFLSGPKFTGTDPDGSRKDWIATADVQRVITELRNVVDGM